MRGVYWLYFGCLCSLNLLPGRTIAILSFSGFLRSTFSTLVVLRNSFISFICMNLVTLILSSSRSATGFLHKLSTNRHGLRALMRWCIATFGFRLLIFNKIFANRSMNSLKGSSFSWHIFTRVGEVSRWGLQ